MSTRERRPIISIENLRQFLRCPDRARLARENDIQLQGTGTSSVVRSLIRKMESGEAQPSASTIDAIARNYGGGDSEKVYKAKATMLNFLTGPTKSGSRDIVGIRTPKPKPIPGTYFLVESPLVCIVDVQEGAQKRRIHCVQTGAQGRTLHPIYPMEACLLALSVPPGKGEITWFSEARGTGRVQLVDEQHRMLTGAATRFLREVYTLSTISSPDFRACSTCPAAVRQACHKEKNETDKNPK